VLEEHFPFIIFHFSFVISAHRKVPRCRLRFAFAVLKNGKREIDNDEWKISLVLDAGGETTS